MPSSSFFSGTNPTPTEYENAVDLVAQASAQATAALASANTATTASQSAQGYSVSAGTSAETATQQAAAAATSAAGALASQNAAATSATAAGSSATAASSSASSASTSATNAANSATSAAGSATSAGTYATNAANSATAAANSASDAAATLASALVKTNNLSDLSNPTTARSNLGVAIGSNVQAWDADLDAIAAISSTSGLLKKTAANTWSLDTTSYHSGTLGLSQGGTGATDAAGARTALGLGTAATAAATSFVQVANNLSDLVSASSARSNLGLGSVATLASTAVLQSANNLSDLGNVTTARTNLGLSALATTTPGTGVATALGVNTGTAGAFVVNGGSLGTPASGNLANCTFPTLNQNTTGTAGGLSATLGVASGGTGLTSLTAGYIPYGNGTGAFSSDSNLFWDNTNKYLGIGTSIPSQRLNVAISSNAMVARFWGTSYGLTFNSDASTGFRIEATDPTGVVSYQNLILSGLNTVFNTYGSERMRIASDGSVTWGNSGSGYLMTLTSGGSLGIGTSSPETKLQVVYSVGANTNGPIDIRDTTSYAAGVGGRLVFSGQYNSSNQYTQFAAIQGVKANSSSGDFGGNLLLQVRANGAGSYTTAATLDSAGNLGLGVTPSAWSNDRKVVQINRGALVSGNSAVFTNVSNNNYFDGTNIRYIATGGASTYVQGSDSSHTWYQAPSGSAGSAISFTQAMTLDASGQLGVGATSPSRKITINDSTSSYLGYQVGASEKWVVGVDTSTRYIIYDATAAQNRVTIDTSGNVGIGTSSPAARLDVQQAGNQIAKFVATTGTASSYISISNTGGDFHVGRENSAGTTFGLTAYSSVLWAGGAYPLIMAVNGSERARIDSSGNLLVGTTSASFSSTNYGIVLKPNAETFWITNTPGNIIAFNRNSDGGIFKFFRSGTEVGSVTVTTTATTYGTSSDISLKEKISDASSALSSILSMPIRQFDWKADGSHTDYGVIAQEANEFAPEIVAKKDIWQVDYGRITPRLIKAFQELAAEVAALKGQLNG